MSELLWRCQDGTVLSSGRNGLELVVSRAWLGEGFRYQLLQSPPGSTAKISVATGYRQNLTDAISAAEAVARGWGTRGRWMGQVSAVGTADPLPMPSRQDMRCR